MRDLLRPMLPMIVVLAIPIVPFLLFGERVEAWLGAWRDHPPAAPIVAAAVVLLLATDVFLPIPSSLVSTLAGSQLGAMGGTAASWTGMSLGAIVGFAIARRYGPGLAGWLTRKGDVRRTAALVERFGPLLLVLGRGVPVLAEATVLLFGMHGLTWRQFLPPVLLANLGLALAYSLFGELAQRYHSLPLALAVAIALPVLMVAAFRAWAGPGDSQKPSPVNEPNLP
ncbi:MAG: VTT domain-containing protein [Planctomycetaceae bacterium]|nr:VTT domain-containing protein [Planctomycetaceae bacterium]